MNANALTVLLQQLTALCLGAGPLLAKGCIAQHLADGHAGRLQAAEKRDPDQDRRIVVAAAGAIPVRIGQQPDPLIVTDRMGRQS